MPSFFIFRCRFGRFKPKRNFRRIWLPAAKTQRYFGRTMLKGLCDDTARWAHRLVSRLRRSGGPMRASGPQSIRDHPCSVGQRFR